MSSVVDARKVAAAFLEDSGRVPRLFAAPGRVNLIGEHTDYNDGFVLPMAIDRGTLVAAAPRADRWIRARTRNTADVSPPVVEIDLDHPGQPRRGTWVDYIEGVVRALERAGVSLVGADLLLESDIPVGAGLSSSAALEVSVGLALTRLAGTALEPAALARAGQRAEHEHVGTQCGIMDQLIAVLGQAGHALLIDCRSGQARPVAMTADGIAVVLCNTRVKHELASSAYNQRRRECEEAVQLLGQVLPGIRALRDVSPAELDEHGGRLPDVLRRRARHIVDENARTVAAAAALTAGDMIEAGRLMFDSHRSMRDDYEISCAELDVLVEAAAATPGVFGGRMTGGGFGGCTVNLVESAAVERFAAEARGRYAARFGREPELFVTRACDGARELEP